MIEYSQQDSPILSKDRSGDFSYVYEDEEFYFIAVGDIGGHGSKQVYSMAQQTIKLLAAHYAKSLESILYFIHNQSDFKSNGMVLFLAKIFKKTPIIEYINIGNIKANILSKSSSKELLLQEGIVAYIIPSDIQTNITKLNYGDKLIITTDGISNNIDFNYLKTLNKAQQIASHIIKKSALPNDDSLCLSIIYKQDPQVQIQHMTKTTKQSSNTTPTVKKTTKCSQTYLRKKKIRQSAYQKIQNLVKLEKKFHLCTIEYSDKKYKEKLYEIFHFCGLQDAQSKQFTTLIYELKCQFETAIDLYLNPQLLQVHFKVDQDYLESVSVFFENYSYTNNLFISNILLDNFIYDQGNVDAFKELLYFSLDKDSIEMNKKLHEEVNKKVALLMQSQKLQQELSQKAYLDKLTGIYNRHKFEEIFKYENDRFKRYETSFSLALLDIDHFKKFNDTYGHQVGDEVLQMFSQYILKQIRATDKFARWGGEEFVILFSSTTLSQAFDVAQKLRKGIEQMKHPSAGQITVSFGLSEVRNNDDIVSLLTRCDEALYKAKENGRNRIEVYKE